MGLIGFDVNVSTITDLSSILSSSTNFDLLPEAGDVHRLAPLCPRGKTAVDFAMCREHNGLGNRDNNHDNVSRLLDFHIQHVDIAST